MSWYQTFFEGDVVESWLRIVTPEWTTADADFLERTLQLPAGGKVLDIACGSGRHSIELARRGFRTTGIDLSPEFLAVARRDAPELDWRDCNIATGDLAAGGEAQFDGAFQIGNSFSYLDRESMPKYLRALARALKPGARFVFDTGAAAESVLPKTESQRWYQLGENRYMLSQSRYDTVRGEQHTDYTFLRYGEGQTKRCVYRVDTLTEIRTAFQAAEFDLTSAWADQSGKPFDLGSQLLIGVAVRRGV